MGALPSSYNIMMRIFGKDALKKSMEHLKLVLMTKELCVTDSGSLGMMIMEEYLTLVFISIINLRQRRIAKSLSRVDSSL